MNTVYKCMCTHSITYLPEMESKVYLVSQLMRVCLQLKSPTSSTSQVSFTFCTAVPVQNVEIMWKLWVDRRYLGYTIAIYDCISADIIVGRREDAARFL